MSRLKLTPRLVLPAPQREQPGPHHLHHTTLDRSDQVHTIWRTPSYSLSGVVWSPNDSISPNSQQRWVGLIFGNANHTALGMHHITGEKWGMIDADIGIYHKCAICHYQGRGSTVVNILKLCF